MRDLDTGIYSREKLDRVKELLKQGYSLRRALRDARLGWKTYHEYEEYILADPEVPRPKKIDYVKVGPVKIDYATYTILRELSRDVAERLVMRRHKTVNLKGLEKEVRWLERTLRKIWLEEMALSAI